MEESGEALCVQDCKTESKNKNRSIFVLSVIHFYLFESWERWTRSFILFHFPNICNIQGVDQVKLKSSELIPVCYGKDTDILIICCCFNYTHWQKTRIRKRSRTQIRHSDMECDQHKLEASSRHEMSPPDCLAWESQNKVAALLVSGKAKWKKTDNNNVLVSLLYFSTILLLLAFYNQSAFFIEVSNWIVFSIYCWGIEDEIWKT